MLPSSDEQKGHDLVWGCPGVYSSTSLRTALQYSRGCDIFDMDILLKPVFELECRKESMRKSGNTGNNFYTPDVSNVVVKAVLVLLGCKLNVDYGAEQFVPLYNPWLEAGHPMRDAASGSAWGSGSRSACESGAPVRPERAASDWPCQWQKRPAKLHPQDQRFHPQVRSRVIYCDHCESKHQRVCAIPLLQSVRRQDQ